MIGALLGFILAEREAPHSLESTIPPPPAGLAVENPSSQPGIVDFLPESIPAQRYPPPNSHSEPAHKSLPDKDLR